LIILKRPLNYTFVKEKHRAVKQTYFWCDCTVHNLIGRTAPITVK
jgi:hypothetical protein